MGPGELDPALRPRLVAAARAALEQSPPSAEDGPGAPLALLAELADEEASRAPLDFVWDQRK